MILNFIYDKFKFYIKILIYYNSCNNCNIIITIAAIFNRKGINIYMFLIVIEFYFLSFLTFL
jgi:hypothetical protein